MARRWPSPCSTTIWLLILLQLAWLGWLLAFPVPSIPMMPSISPTG